MRVPLCPAVHGHIADSVREHERGLAGAAGSARGQRPGSEGFTEPLAPGSDRPSVLGEEAASPLIDHWSTGRAHAWPTRSADRREKRYLIDGVELSHPELAALREAALVRAWR
jgi:hypothetical protein